MTVAEIQIQTVNSADVLKSEQDASDVSRASVFVGRDPQGVRWLHWERAVHRARLLQEYHNYVSVLDLLPYSGRVKEFHQAELSGVLTPRKDAFFFQFYRKFGAAKSSYVHFQLRNLLWATSSHDVVLVRDNCVLHWNTLTRQSRLVLDCAGRGADSPLTTHSPFQVSTTHVFGDLLAAGGIGGELVLAKLQQDGAEEQVVLHERRVSKSANCITNSIQMHEGATGGVTALVSNNDDCVRIMDVATTTFVDRIPLAWAANCTVANPRRRSMLAIVGDHLDVCLYDLSAGKRIGSLPGHMDFSFAADFHPAGNLLATGNQDATTRVWDIRKSDRSLAVLPATVGSVQSCRFSQDGKWLASAEPTDFVQVYSVHDGLQSAQTLDMLGEFSGIAFSPDSQTLYAGVVAREAEYTCLICFRTPDGLSSDM